MTTLSINELLPSGLSIKKIQTGSELLLAYELAKYAKIMLHKEMVLSEVTIAKELLEGEHFSFVVMNGLDVGFETSREDLADYSKNVKYFFTDTVEGVAFSNVTLDEVVYQFDYNVQANRKLHEENRSASYVSLMAYLIVKAKVEETKVPKLVIDHENYVQQDLEYSDLFVLKLYGNKLLDNLVEIKYSTSWVSQPEWEAFVIYHRQRGMMNAEYSVNEKIKYLKRNFEVGDVVLLYKRSKASKGKSINQLKSCYPAIIKYFDNNTIKLTHFPIVKTTLTHHMELDEALYSLEDEAVGSFYTQEDYDRFTVCNETYNLTTIGVDTCTYVEETFFIKPVDFDGTYQYMRTDNGLDNVWMSTLDTIYAVFEDRGVDYNKDKFLKTYFKGKNREPIYHNYVPKAE